MTPATATPPTQPPVTPGTATISTQPPVTPGMHILKVCKNEQRNIVSSRRITLGRGINVNWFRCLFVCLFSLQHRLHGSSNLIKHDCTIYLHAGTTECMLTILGVRARIIVVEMLGRCDLEKVEHFNLIYRDITTNSSVIMTPFQVQSMEQQFYIFELPLQESEDGDMFSIQVTINNLASYDEANIHLSLYTYNFAHLSGSAFSRLFGVGVKIDSTQL